MLALTLPQDIIEYLQTIDPDVGWAVVKLADQQRGRPSDGEPETAAPPDAQLLPIGPNRFLIVVREDVFGDLPDVSLVPLGHGRAFLAFPKHKTIESLELAVIDLLELERLDDDRRRRYGVFRNLLRAWRHDATLTFHERSIVVVERDAPRPRGRRPR